MKMTKDELLAEITYCYLLNEKVRQRTKSELGGFIWASILCTLFIPACIVMGFRIAVVSQPLALGFTIGLGIVAFILACISIFFIFSCKKELKKCDEIDTKLEEKELQLKQESSQETIIKA